MKDEKTAKLKDSIARLSRPRTSFVHQQESGKKADETSQNKSITTPKAGNRKLTSSVLGMSGGVPKGLLPKSSSLASGDFGTPQSTRSKLKKEYEIADSADGPRSSQGME